MVEERIAILETKVNELQDSNKTIVDKLDNIDFILTKQRGFIGGIVFVFSALFSVALAMIQYVRGTHL